MKLVNGRPTQFYSADFDELEAAFSYTFKIIGVALAVTLFAATKNICLHAYLMDQNTRTKEEGGGGGNFARTQLKDTPHCLGVAWAWYRVSNIILYILPASIVQEEFQIVFEGIALLVTNIVVTWGLVNVMHWHRNKIASEIEEGHNHDVQKMTTRKFAMQEPQRLFVNSMPFVFALCWSTLSYFCVFRVCFSCTLMSVICPGRTQLQFFVQLYYAIAITWIIAGLVPRMKADTALMRRLNTHCIETFLLSDVNFFDQSLVKSDLITSASTIVVGWAWTNIASTECTANFSFTCPEEGLFSSFFLYFLTVCFYTFLTISIYHSMMEEQRLTNRCRKVIAIEDGNGIRLFSNMDKDDKDNDGLLDKQELENFITNEGLNPEPFLQAAAICDERDGIITGDVEMGELMDACDDLMVKIKAGIYNPGEHTMHYKQVEGMRETVARSEHLQDAFEQAAHLPSSHGPVSPSSSKSRHSTSQKDVLQAIAEATNSVSDAPPKGSAWRKTLAHRIATKNNEKTLTDDSQSHTPATPDIEENASGSGTEDRRTSGGRAVIVDL